MAWPAAAAMAAMTILPMLTGTPEQPAQGGKADITGALLRGQGDDPLSGGNAAAFGGDNQQSSILNAMGTQRRDEAQQSPYLAAALRGDNRKTIDSWRGG
jgi:hypothetical protein